MQESREREREKGGASERWGKYLQFFSPAVGATSAAAGGGIARETEASWKSGGSKATTPLLLLGAAWDDVLLGYR